MFTGIIEEMGKVSGVYQGRSSIRLSIACSKIMEEVKTGDSIAVNGICLTVTQLSSLGFIADVMPETMRKTNLHTLKPSDAVNLERALKLSDRLGGHLVSGHIDGTGTIVHKQDEDNAVWFTIEAPSHIIRYVILKGSVALDGTSLTVAYVDDSRFKVSLIPLTRGLTTLGLSRVGDIVNIECDLVGKYVERFLQLPQDKEVQSKLTISFLKENGFA